MNAVAAALGRATVYRLCGAALAYPAPDRLVEIARLAHAAAVVVDRRFREPLTALADAAAIADAESIAAEYVTLFDGAVKCPPYEGAYALPQIAGKSAQLADIAGFYAAFGLEPAAGQPEVEDHVATELEFLSALAVKEAWALAERHDEHALVTRDATASFLADHLGRWACTFASALEASTDVPYYQAAARLIGVWVAADAARLGVDPVPLSRSTPDRDAAEPFSCPMAPDGGFA
jgi:putative dimethyl sulfoxide reductase chaperone